MTGAKKVDMRANMIRCSSVQDPKRRGRICERITWLCHSWDNMRICVRSDGFGICTHWSRGLWFGCMEQRNQILIIYSSQRWRLIKRRRLHISWSRFKIDRWELQCGTLVSGSVTRRETVFEITGFNSVICSLAVVQCICCLFGLRPRPLPCVEGPLPWEEAMAAKARESETRLLPRFSWWITKEKAFVIEGRGSMSGIWDRATSKESLSPLRKQMTYSLSL